MKKIKINIKNKFHFICKMQTCFMAGMEAFPLDRGIGVKDHVHLVAAGGNRVGQLAPTVPPQAVAVDVLTIKDFNVVVRALLVGF